MTQPQQPIPSGRMSAPMRLLLVAVAAISIVLAVSLAFNEGKKSIPAAASPQSPPPPADADPRVTIGIAYGTEKRSWLEEAVQEFSQTPQGQKINVKLIPLGSLEAAQRIWKKDTSINVWSPASALYKNLFVQEWKGQNSGDNPIASEESLALTPMVFVMWEERYQAFVRKYGQLTFPTVASAMAEKQGWAAIANQPDWMFFKFSHTDPNQSNSGLMALVLMSYDHFAKTRGLSGHDLTDSGFVQLADTLEGGLVAPVGSLSNSTGNLMQDMVRKGPSTYDVIFVYESVAIDQLRHAEGRWDKLRVVYPRYNLWSDNPYYVLNVPWSTPEQRAAAQSFQQFLLGQEMQARAMTHGFRPANTSVMTKVPDSPFSKFADYGLRADLPSAMCEPPPPDVLDALLNRWQQGRGK